MFNSSIDNRDSYWYLSKVTLRSLTKMCTSLLRCRIFLRPWRWQDGDADDLFWSSSYRAGDDADILGILFEPVVHVLTHRKQVVEAGSLSRGPVAFRHLETEASAPRSEEDETGATARKRCRRERRAGVSNSREDESSGGDSATSRRPFCSGWVNAPSCQMVAGSTAGVCWSLIKNTRSLICFSWGELNKTWDQWSIFFFLVIAYVVERNTDKMHIVVTFQFMCNFLW